MQTIKSKRKAYELASEGLLLYIDNGRYAIANVGLVISSFETITFYVKKKKKAA